MNNILCINMCLLAVATMVCSSSATTIRNGSLSEALKGSHFSGIEDRSFRVFDRQRRGMPQQLNAPDTNIFYKCCRVAKPLGADVHAAKMFALFIYCFEADESGDNGPQKILRAKGCVAKNENLIDDAGNLQEAGIKAAFQALPLAEHLRTIVNSTVKSCMAEANDSRGGSIFHTFEICVDREFLNECPKSLQDPSERCNKMRAGKSRY